jgi:hypothetical protein
MIRGTGKALPLRKTTVQARNVRPGDYLENADGTASRVNSVAVSHVSVVLVVGSRVSGQWRVTLAPKAKTKVRRWAADRRQWMPTVGSPQRPLELGCTTGRHAALGIDAVVNARGEQWSLNHETDEEIEMQRDANKVRDWVSGRVRIYQFNSRHFRRSPIAHLATGWASE